MNWTGGNDPRGYLPTIPRRDWPLPDRSTGTGSFADASTMNEAGKASQPSQLTMATEQDAIPLHFGRVRYGLKPHIAEIINGDLFLVAALGEGEIDAVLSVELNERMLPAGVSWGWVAGTPTQPVIPAVAAALASLTPPITYADSVPSVALLWIRIPPSVQSITLPDNSKPFASEPRVTVTLRGMRVYDPRIGSHVISNPTTWAWSDNPALALAQFITSGYAPYGAQPVPRYGRNRTIDIASLIAAANWCDSLVGVAPNQEKRRTLNLSILDPREDEVWEAALRTYAGCYVDVQGSNVVLIPDAPRSVVHTLDDSKILSYRHHTGRDRGQVPTQIEIEYTNISAKPWRQDKAVAQHPSVLSGGARRVSQVAMPGIHRYSQALREAMQRLNTLTLSDLLVGLTLFDETLAWQKGDLVSVSNKLGLTNKLMTVEAIRDLGFGRWDVELSEYDPAFWYDQVVPVPTYTDTGSANCAIFPAVTAFSIIQQNQFNPAAGCACERRLALNWTVGYYPCLLHYELEIYQNGTLWQTITTASPAALSMPITPGAAYYARVRIVSNLTPTTFGPWHVSATITANAAACKPDPPGGVWVCTSIAWHESASPPYLYNMARVVHIDAPPCPVSTTEVWASDNPTGTFASASLVFSGAGHVPIVSYHRTKNWFTFQFDGTTRVFEVWQAGASPPPNTVPPWSLVGPFEPWNYPAPRKIWVRFITAGVPSDPVEVRLSLPEMPFNNTPAVYDDDWAIAIDGTFYNSNGAQPLIRTLPQCHTAWSPTYFGASRAMQNLTNWLGQTAYQYLGAPGHQITMDTFDAYGSPASGWAQFQMHTIYEG